MKTSVIQKPDVKIDKALLAKLKELHKEESQVIVHCIYASEPDYDSYIRIWPSTFLFDHQSEHRSELVHVEKISMFPQWMLVPAGIKFHFSLIFSGLPSDCVLFDLKEVIPQSGGFQVGSIHRNDTDVYFVNIV